MSSLNGISPEPKQQHIQESVGDVKMEKVPATTDRSVHWRGHKVSKEKEDVSIHIDKGVIDDWIKSLDSLYEPRMEKPAQKKTEELDSILEEFEDLLDYKLEEPSQPQVSTPPKPPPKPEELRGQRMVRLQATYAKDLPGTDKVKQFMEKLSEEKDLFPMPKRPPPPPPTQAKEEEPPTPKVQFAEKTETLEFKRDEPVSKLKSFHTEMLDEKELEAGTKLVFLTNLLNKAKGDKKIIIDKEGNLALGKRKFGFGFRVGASKEARNVGETIVNQLDEAQKLGIPINEYLNKLSQDDRFGKILNKNPDLKEKIIEFRVRDIVNDLERELENGKPIDEYLKKLFQDKFVNTLNRNPELKEKIIELRDREVELKVQQTVFNPTYETILKNEIDFEKSLLTLQTKKKEAEKSNDTATMNAADKDMSNLRKKFEKDNPIDDELSFIEYIVTKEREKEKLIKSYETENKLPLQLKGTVNNMTAREMADHILKQSIELNQKYGAGEFLYDKVRDSGHELTKFENNLALYATSSIYSSNSPEEAAQRLAGLVDTAYILTQKGDINSAKGIMDGLLRENIPDLGTRILKGDLKETEKRFSELKKIYSGENNYKQLRALTASLDVYIPPITIVSQDTFSSKDSTGAKPGKLQILAKILKDRENVKEMEPPVIAEGSNKILDQVNSLAEQERFNLTDVEKTRALDNAKQKVEEYVGEKLHLGIVVTDEEKKDLLEQFEKEQLAGKNSNKIAKELTRERKAFWDKHGIQKPV